MKKTFYISGCIFLILIISLFLIFIFHSKSSSNNGITPSPYKTITEINPGETVQLVDPTTNEPMEENSSFECEGYTWQIENKHMVTESSLNLELGPTTYSTSSCYNISLSKNGEKVFDMLCPKTPPTNSGEMTSLGVVDYLQNEPDPLNSHPQDPSGIYMQGNLVIPGPLSENVVSNQSLAFKLRDCFTKNSNTFLQ